MFINPRVAIEKGWLRGVRDIDAQLTPNAIDITIDRIDQVHTHNKFIITADDKKHHRGSSQMLSVPHRDGSGDYWHLDNGIYDWSSSMYVEIPEGYAGWIIVRSSFNRNGIFLTSGLYDQNFKGHLAGMLHNRGGEAWVQPGSRIGQFLIVRSEDTGILYQGGYSVDEGKHWTDTINPSLM